MRKAIKSILAKAVPIYLVEQVTNEVRLATRRMLTSRSVRRRLVSQKGIRVNIGCGSNPTQGWINLDVVSHPGVYFGTAGRACHFPTALSRRFTRSIFSSILISKARHAHFFANACGVCSLEAFCGS